MALDGLAGRFLDLHEPGRPLLQPNAFDAGSARILAGLGFQAIATTSSGFAATLGRLDGRVTRDELLLHAAHLADAVEVPVAADSEDGYAADPEGVAETVGLLAATGLAGCSIEDFTRQADEPIYELGLAVERVAAAAEAAHAGPQQLVLTARAENALHGRDLDDTIARLQAYQEAGADVLFAPGVTDAESIRAIVTSVDKPVNVLALEGTPPVAELAELGVARVSIGGAYAYAAYGALIRAATEFRDQGTYSWWADVTAARAHVRDALR